MGVPVMDYLARRRNRCVGSVLGYAEREIFPKIDKTTEQAFRQLVRDAVGSYHDSIVDLVKTDDGTRNEEVIRLLEQLQTTVESRTMKQSPPAS